MVGESVGDLTQWQDRRAQTLESMQMVMGPLPDQSDLESLDVEVIETIKIARIERRKSAIWPSKVAVNAASLA